jgi:hypothetical protein
MAPRNSMIVQLDIAAVRATIEENIKSLELQDVVIRKNNAAEHARYDKEYDAWTKAVKAQVVKHPGRIRIGSYTNTLLFEGGIDLPAIPNGPKIELTNEMVVERMKKTLSRLKMVIGTTIPSNFEGIDNCI